MEQDRYNYGLDVQRALAMLFVVLYHAPLYIPVLHDGADVGVNRCLFIGLKSLTSICVDCFWPLVSGPDLKTPILLPRVLVGCLVVFVVGILLNWSLKGAVRLAVRTFRHPPVAVDNRKRV